MVDKKQELYDTIIHRFRSLSHCLLNKMSAIEPVSVTQGKGRKLIMNYVHLGLLSQDQDTMDKNRKKRPRIEQDDMQLGVLELTISGTKIGQL